MVKLLNAPRDPILKCNSTTPPSLVLINNKGNEEYEIEAILDNQMF
jgi:hypothetical protein